ncbi:MAG: sigma 54-interacting transcriptional regulator, partial [Pseudomonadota bacterium]
RIGRFEQAHGGTLFLDEIGDMPNDLQTRLLRVLSDSEFFRVGGARPLQADVRIVAATHQDLETQVANGAFREDLFHRLNVIRLRVPPLRERKEDIPLLLDHFLAHSATELGVSRKFPTPDMTEYLSGLTWPGNVRQLENTAHWLTVMASGRELQITDLPDALRAPESNDLVSGDWTAVLRQWADGALSNGQTGLLPEATKALERTLINSALAATGGRKQEAARLLGWGRNTLTRKISELEL